MKPSWKHSPWVVFSAILLVVAIYFLAAEYSHLRLALVVVTSVLFVFSLLLLAHDLWFPSIVLRSVEAWIPSARVTLTPAQNVRWRDAATAERLTENVRNLGFRDIGDFLVDVGSREVPLRTLASEDDVFGTVYEVLGEGVVVGFTTYYDDGGRVSHVSFPEPGMDSPPNQHVAYMPGAAPEDLLERHRHDRPREGRVGATAESFVASYEGSYAAFWDWHAIRGGPSLDEVQHLLRIGRVERADEILARAREYWAIGLREHLRALFFARLKETSTLPEAQLDAMQDRLIYVHDELDEAGLRRLFEERPDHDALGMSSIWDTDDLAEEVRLQYSLAAAHGSPSARRVFRMINDMLAPHLRYVKFGEVDRPVAADVWLTSSALTEESSEPASDQVD